MKKKEELYTCNYNDEIVISDKIENKINVVSQALTHFILNELKINYDKDQGMYNDYMPDFLAEEFLKYMFTFSEFIKKLENSQEEKEKFISKYIIKWDLI